jgi:hypothetical protein
VWCVTVISKGAVEESTTHGRRTVRTSLRFQPSAQIVFALFLVSFACIPLPAVAGGSWDRVSIERLSTDGVNYTLVVTPSPPQGAVVDPLLGQCKRLEVRGTYRWLKGAIFRQERALSREGHLEALEYLRQSFLAKRSIDFGEIGTGFVPVDSKNPCIVRSRALWLATDERGTHVLSFYVSTNARSD